MKNKFTDSLAFKTWLFFIIFSLSVILILQVFQLVLFEPFYDSTMKREIKSLTQQVVEIYFSNNYQQKEQSIRSLTIQNDACIVIVNLENNSVAGYDSLGTNNNVLYNENGVNADIISKIISSSNNEILLQGQYSETSSKESMIYGMKIENNGIDYIFIANINLQSINTITKTIINQMTFIFGIVLLLSLAVGFILSKKISKPIESITNEAKKLQSGNFDLSFGNYDINEVNQLANTIDLASKEIGKIDEYRNELMANVSHDIKTPLTMIKAYAEMIKDISGDNREKRDEHLNIIIEETDNLTRLVSDMVDLSKLQAGAIQINFEPFDLTTLINDSIKRFDVLTKHEDIKIICDCDTELIAMGDEKRINEVMYNFLTNAIKHVGEDKEVVVNCKLINKDKIKVEIIDHGCGIDEKTLPYIWDRYFKIDKNYIRSQTGTGLGLAINKAILEAHKSEYGVESKVDIGSTFYFYLQAQRMG